MGIFLRQKWKQKPEQWGSFSDVQSGLFNALENIGIDPADCALAMPMWNLNFQHGEFAHGFEGNSSDVFKYEKKAIYFQSSEIDFPKGIIEVQDCTMITSINPTDNTEVMLGGIVDDITKAGVEFGKGHTNNNLMFAYYDGSIRGWYESSDNLCPPGILSNVAIRCRKTKGLVDFFSGGFYDKTVSTTTNSILYNNNTVRVGEGHYTNPKYLGYMYFYLLFSTALNSDQIASLSDNPYQLWQPYSSVIYAKTSTSVATDSLTSQDITIANPVIDSPTIGQIHVLISTDITAANPVIDQPTIGQIQVLTSQDITTGSPVIDKPTITDTSTTDALTSKDITIGSPVIDTPTIGQIQVLISQDVIMESPDIGSPVIGQVHALISQDIITVEPTISRPIVDRVVASSSRKIFSLPGMAFFQIIILIIILIIN